MAGFLGNFENARTIVPVVPSNTVCWREMASSGMDGERNGDSIQTRRNCRGGKCAVGRATPCIILDCIEGLLKILYKFDERKY